MAGPLVENTRWIRLDFDVLRDERGAELVEVGDAVLGGTLIERATNGTVYYGTLDGLFKIDPTATEPVRVADGEVHDLRRTVDGEVVAYIDQGYVNAATGDPVEAESGQPPERIIAANGLAVEHVPGDFELDDDAWIAHVNRGDGIRLLDHRGDQMALWELGGPAAPLVSLVDFDGRYILAARGPEEPALPLWDHFLIDLQGSSEEVLGFAAIPGTVALATADDPVLPSSFRIPPIAVCPTWSSTVLKEAPAGLPTAVAKGFDQVALALARCDTWFTRRSEAMIEWDDDHRWIALQTSLLGPFAQTDEGWVWNGGAGTEITIDPRGQVTVALPAEESFELWIILGENDLSIGGSTGPSSAGRLAKAGQTAASERRVDFHDTFLSSAGPEIDDLTLMAVEEFIGTSIGLAGDDIAFLEAHVDEARLRVWAGRRDNAHPVAGELTSAALAEAGIELVERVDPLAGVAAEREIVRHLRAFADGDSAAVAAIPWAPEVSLAAGPVLAAVRTPNELAEPSSWSLDVGPFRGGDGAISALTVLDRAEWTELAAGPHPHCASPPVPAPASLAGLRRVSIQTADIDSCLQWATIDLFIDEDDQVAGISVDHWEP